MKEDIKILSEIIWKTNALLEEDVSFSV